MRITEKKKKMWIWWNPMEEICWREKSEHKYKIYIIIYTAKTTMSQNHVDKAVDSAIYQPCSPQQGWTWQHTSRKRILIEYWWNFYGWQIGVASFADIVHSIKQLNTNSKKRKNNFRLYRFPERVCVCECVCVCVNV